MKKNKQHIKKFGIVGYPLEHSFSKKYFTEKFKKSNNNNYEYINFELKNIDEIIDILKENPEISGLNITAPYKESILKYVDYQDDIVKKIKATNTLKIHKGKIYAYNTDVYGFEKSFVPFLKEYHKKALVFGTGGASKAVVFVLKKIKIPYLQVSRKPQNNLQISYLDINKKIIENHKILINTTPVGSYPRQKESLQIPYDSITKNHFFYDLIYNPDKTIFLQKAEKNKAATSNGLKMLYLQAEKSWEIWNKKK